MKSKFFQMKRNARGNRNTRPLESGTRISSLQCGFTLIEIMVVISIATLMISLVGMTFHMILRSEKLVSQSLVTERTISNLANQFRSDVHESEDGIVTADESQQNFELALGDSAHVRVRYRASPAGLIRVVMEGDDVVSREDYRLPECRILIEGGPESNPRLRSIVIRRPSATVVQKEQAPRPVRAIPIEAYLQKPDPRHQKPADEKTDAESNEAVK